MRNSPTRPLILLALLVAPGLADANEPEGAGRGVWSQTEAASWARSHPWLVGCNFIPSTAINQLEMWQADTFDPSTIDRELGWAEGLGFNSVRVFLHHLPWESDRQGFLDRIGQFLAIAERHKIGVMFVLLDGVWDPFPHAGKQHAPIPGLHNSGWVQSPGLVILRNPDRHDELKDYVTGVIGHFRADRRIDAWDLFNEPENPNRSSYGRLEPANKPELALALLKKEFAWARSVSPTQPLTAGAWTGDLTDPRKLSPINRLMLEQSDVISFHNYKPIDEMRRDVEALRRYGRPILCTEYMARPAGSRFDPVLGYLRSQRVGAYNWGFVAGKSQTVYPWDSWKKPYPAEPPVWFHDIFRPDGTPFDRREVDYIRGQTTLRKAG
ncbi:MAG: cellulase family glycosylhydrolase [Isosphaeraceae bacterium]